MKLNKLLLQGKFFQLEIYGELQVAAPNNMKAGESLKWSQSLWSGCCCHLLIIGNSPQGTCSTSLSPWAGLSHLSLATTLQRSKAGDYSHSPLCPVQLPCWERRKDGLRREDWRLPFVLSSAEPLHVSSKENEGDIADWVCPEQHNDSSSVGWVIPRKHTLSECWVSATAIKRLWRGFLFLFYLTTQWHLNTVIQIGQRGSIFWGKQKSSEPKWKPENVHISL